MEGYWWLSYIQSYNNSRGRILTHNTRLTIIKTINNYKINSNERLTITTGLYIYIKVINGNNNICGNIMDSNQIVNINNRLTMHRTSGWMINNNI